MPFSGLMPSALQPHLHRVEYNSVNGEHGEEPGPLVPRPPLRDGYEVFARKRHGAIDAAQVQLPVMKAGVYLGVRDLDKGRDKIVKLLVGGVLVV